MRQPLSNDNFDDEALQMAIELSLAESKTRNHQTFSNFVTTKTKAQSKKKAKKPSPEFDEFEQYWKESCKFLRSCDRHRRRAWTRHRLQQFDSSVNQRQLSGYTPYGALPAYVQYLLHTKCAALRELIPSVKELLKYMEVWRWTEVWKWRQRRTDWWYPNMDTYELYKSNDYCKMSVSDPRAAASVHIDTVLDADAMQRFVHRLQNRKDSKKANQIGLVYTTVDLAELEWGISVTMKSSSTPQDESDMIRYFGKDLLISGFLRQFSGDTVYDDVEALCLRFYHLHGVAHQYDRRFMRNELLRCHKYESVAGWSRGTAYLCLSPLWVEEGAKNRQLHSLLPVYRVSIEDVESDEHTVQSTYPRTRDRWGRLKYQPVDEMIRKRSRFRYIQRKWSAYHKLNRM